ncbi:PREDICTED: mucin-5AC-like isoform X1 [Amphimedon queenslandica]|uniref:Uncharacterized protein n=1 Tax=Amphimedon queenslandica TaxID=400682 RepID=A0AAN0JXT8_AMPQE|nr:PREDICTED: mucin-5AC-like isoform X1 [Amphimedon queenslandica]|eukprot:XP_019862012.1 PREDICTED: mucin-5AC-like isoform X1 [Amphimedon queenslandica]
MNVLNPRVGGAGAVAMETLIGFTPLPKSKPKATPSTTTPTITTSKQAPPPLTSTLTPPTPPPASIKVATTITTTSGPSIDELLSNTMSGLGDTKPNQHPLTKSDFKSTPPIRGLETRPSPTPVNETYSVSTKAAKVWEKGGEELSGLFKTETSGGTNEISFSPGSDDGFGDFQSVVSNTATSTSVSGNSVTSNAVTSNSVLPSAAGRERVGGGGIQRALPLMTSPAVGSPVLVCS